MTVDEILNNSVFTSPYYGDIMCSFCCNMIATRDIADVMAHLVNRHKKLVRSWFNCRCVQGLRDRGPPHEVSHWRICREGSV